MDEHLKALGSNDTKYSFDKPIPELLEVFDNPMPQGLGYHSLIKIECPEFTSLCPITGQPDFAKIVIEYKPAKFCIESKSLKLYLMGYRNSGEFHEKCVARIAGDLISKLDPVYLKIEGQFTPRGGIPFWPTIKYHSSFFENLE